MKNYSPVVIGGVGGSGTRLIAQILIDLGYNLGNDLNVSADNLWFTLLFKRVNVLEEPDARFSQLLNILTTSICTQKMLSSEQIKMIDQLADTERTQHGKDVLKIMAESLKNNANNSTSVKWGWKEPNSHVVIKQLKKNLPTMKYIHVIRNGLDMAYSENQNQLIFWGQHYFKKDLEVTPANSLKYWCKVHKDLIVNTQSMKEDFYLLNFDEFCHNPLTGLTKLSQFLRVELKKTETENILSLVKPPKSIGRYKQYQLSVFNPEDIAYVKHLCFDTG